MNLFNIENNFKKLTYGIDQENFIFDFLLALEQPKSTINMLKKGNSNKSKNNNELIWNKKILYKKISKDEDVHYTIDDLSKDKNLEKYKIRFLIVTDFKHFLSIDLKTNDTLDIEFSEISKNYHFFRILFHYLV